MDSRLAALDWTLIQSFLAVAKEGSLSAAARRLDASQPTLGRHIKAIEEAFAAPLFTRHARGFALTEVGRSILPSAERMAEAMNDIRLTAAAGETALTGTVRLTASVNVSHALLPPVMAEARALYPGIQLDLAVSDDSENLLFGESDIAIRMYRPTQLDLVMLYLGAFEVGLYAATCYLDRVGRSSDIDALMARDLVGYDRDRRVIDGMIAAGIPADRGTFATRCDAPMTQWELIAAGCGLGFGACATGEADPRVERIPLPFDIPSLPMWLTTSQALRRTPRIAAIWELLAERLGRGPGAPAWRAPPA